jgi:outer membrane protein assembly factor BamB
VVCTALAVLALTGDGERPLAERWRVALDGTPTGAVVAAGDLALVATVDGRVVAVDAGSGVPRWRFLSGQRATAPLAAGAGVALLATAAPAGGGTVFAVDLRTGEERWRLDTEAAVTVAPVVDDAGVYVADGDVRSLETGTGAERWRQEVAGGAGALGVAEGTVVAAAGDGVVALDTGTGALRWGSGGGRPPVGPGIVGGLVVLAADDGLVARALADGAERWRAEDVGAPLQAVVPGPGAVVAVTDEGIVALDAGDGTWRWRAGPRGDDRLRASAEASWMAAVSGAGHLVVDGVTGDVLAAGRWAGIDDDVEPAAPTMVQGDVLVHDGRGVLAALRPTSG